MPSSVTESWTIAGFRYTVAVAPEDMGKVIGKGGRTAKAIRTVVRAAATRAGHQRLSSTSSTEVDEPTVVVGSITKAHGLTGEVAVEVRSDNPDRFAVGASVFTRGRARRSRSSAPIATAARLLVRVRGATDRTAAEAPARARS